MAAKWKSGTPLHPTTIPQIRWVLMSTVLLPLGDEAFSPSIGHGNQHNEPPHHCETILTTPAPETPGQVPKSQ